MGGSVEPPSGSINSKRCGALEPGPARDVALGLAYSKAGQADRAVVLLRHASERYPNDRGIFLALGRVWLESAQARSDRVDLNKALEALEKAVDDDSSSEACLLYGRALLLAADADSAERMLAAGDAEAARRSARLLLPG